MGCGVWGVGCGLAAVESSRVAFSALALVCAHVRGVGRESNARDNAHPYGRSRGMCACEAGALGAGSRFKDVRRTATMYSKNDEYLQPTVLTIKHQNLAYVFGAGTG